MTRLALILLLASACTTVSPIRGVTLEKDTGDQCTHHCGDLGMRMSAVVIISNMTGCVCEPREAKTGQQGGASAVTSGAVAALMAAQEAERQAAAQQQYR